MSDTKLVAFHGDPTVKKKFLARVRAHREADRIIQGQYWHDEKYDGNFRGCAVGCTLHEAGQGIRMNFLDGELHGLYPVELGVPVSVAHLEDVIFESVPTPSCCQEGVACDAWPETFLAAIPVGADLSEVTPKFFEFAVEGLAADVFARCESESLRECLRLSVEAIRKYPKGDLSDSELSAVHEAGEKAYWDEPLSSPGERVAAAIKELADYIDSDHSTAMRSFIDNILEYYDFSGRKGEITQSYAAKVLELLAAAPVPEPASLPVADA